MKSTLSFVLLTVGLFYAIENVCAQKPVFLAPQKHKLLYADTVYREAIAKHDSLLLAEAYYLYAKTYEATGDRIKAQGYFFKSLRILEPRGDSPKLSRLYNRIAQNEIVHGRYREAREYCDKALAAALRTGTSRSIIQSYDNLANFHLKDWTEGGHNPHLPKSHPDSTWHYYRLIESQIRKNMDSLELAHNSLVMAEFALSRYNDVGTFYKKLYLALDIFTTRKKEGERILIFQRLARYHLKENHYKTAWKLIEQAQKIYNSGPINFVDHKNGFDKFYSEYYQKTGDWKWAFKFSDSLRQLQSAEYFADRDVALARLSKEYETEKKDAQLRAKDIEIGLRSEALGAQQKFSFTLAGFLMLAMVMAGLFYKLNKKNYRISKQNELLIKEQNHRVKNNLQAISSLLSLQSSALSDPMAHKAIEESRLRIETIALIHRRLYEGDHLAVVNVPEFLEELTESVLAT